MLTSIATIDEHYRVLLVSEDVREARRILPILAEAGLECRFAPDESAACAALGEVDPAVIIADLAIGNQRALHLLNELRSRPRRPPVVLIGNEAIAGPVDQK